MGSLILGVVFCVGWCDVSSTGPVGWVLAKLGRLAFALWVYFRMV